VSFFEGFSCERVAGLRVRHGGDGPAVLLLHGHPRTHTTWWRVAPLLVEAGFAVVCPDLPGYGRSRACDGSKRAMARALAGMMRELGVARYAVVGHDRGCYAAHRLTVDCGAAVSALAVLDGVPIAEAFSRCDARFAASWWHWFFFAQADKPAEDWIVRDPLAWYRGDPGSMGALNWEDWRRAVTDPDVVRAMVADYRAGWEVDRHDEAADREAGRLVRCPTLCAWSVRDDMETLYGDPLAVWRPWIDGPLHGARIDSGHHMAEEAPEALAAALMRFLADAAAPAPGTGSRPTDAT
jgi:haloacetate dehalogenase